MTLKCHLLDLPYQLRLHIYSHLLLTETPISITDSPPRPSQIQHIHLYPQLLRTCRQLSAEGAAVLYGDNTFETLGHANGYYGRFLARWLARIGGANVARLGRLKVTVLYSPPKVARTGVPGLCCVETTISLRPPRRSGSVMKFWRPEQEARALKMGMGPWTGELDPDTDVEVRLEALARQNVEAGEQWHALDIMALYDAASRVQPVSGVKEFLRWSENVPWHSGTSYNWDCNLSKHAGTYTTFSR